MVSRVSLNTLRVALCSFTFIVSVVWLTMLTGDPCTWKIASPSTCVEKEQQSSAMDPAVLQGLNHHIWVNICASSIALICETPLFPNVPSYRRFISTTEYFWPDKKDFAQRVFGYLQPDESGFYAFAISSDDSSELWLSKDQHIRNSALVAHVGNKRETEWTEFRDFVKFKSQISRKVFLEKGELYFIDIVHVQLGEGNHVSVLWKKPEEKNFTSISTKHLLPFFTNDENMDGKFDWRVPQTNACKNLDNPYNGFLNATNNKISDWQSFSKVLPHCDDYVATPKVRIKQTGDALTEHYRETYMYPYIMRMHRMFFVDNFWRTRELSREDATEVVTVYMEKLYQTFGSKYKLITIENVEKKIFENGTRYLLELTLNDTVANSEVHLSNYVYQPTNSSELCSPESSQWDRKAIVTVKNQGPWVHLFLENIARLVHESRDRGIRVVIFDYESHDLDLEDAVKTSGIAEIVKTVSKPGKYSRREAFNVAINLVTDPNSIVLLTDLHLEMTSLLLKDIRKHCIQGQQVYTPVIIRQGKCSSPRVPMWGYIGYWETLGFGIVAMYKSDWDRTGGFKFDDSNKHKWGGEDYELVDSVVEAGLGFERVGCPYIYHYMHIREGMWE
ncbi:beta-1,4-N-acetylgalactosaminyltransferase 3 [Nematostella vectensis]|nr:beta-1,4-N-acetylgalactosaminyltransferase 3 [Nematostella vectensis]